MYNGDMFLHNGDIFLRPRSYVVILYLFEHRIDKEDISPICRLCGEREETLAHIVSECKTLAQKQYKHWRHDKVAQVIHWDLCKRHNLGHTEKWYEHQPQPVTENENIKILWDMKIQTDKKLDHNKLDIVTIDKEKKDMHYH